MDNYSKYIINWKVESVVSGKLRVETIKDAYKQITKRSHVKLIIDGGPENNNNDVDGFIHAEGVNIIKLIALKDVPFSNSVVEAQNKLLKYRYLFKNQVQDINELRSSLKWIVDDYNNNRPHISLNGLTPYEAYTGKTIDKMRFSAQIGQAKKDRLTQNRKELCIPCM